MHKSTTALISADAFLVKTAEGIVTSFPDCALDVIAEIGDASMRILDEDVALVMVHVTDDASAQAALVLMRGLAEANRPVATLILSEKYHADQALKMLRAGAADYLSRPLDLGRLAYLVDTLTLRHRCAGPRRVNDTGTLALPMPGNGDQFFYVISPEMHQVLEQIRRVAPKDTTLLLSGETGTGKTRLARMIHEMSPRRKEPFLVINCGALSHNLIESEIFGHVRGAFTGADRERTGKFADAGRGSILLDEIDSLPLPLQAKLLRAVDERLFEPVGSNASQPLQARIMTATNRSLEEEVAAGRFRSDLYYRLNVVGFYLPPLRGRRSVIRPLAQKFLVEFATRHSVSVRGVAPEVLRVLEDYDWPGNVRELRNIIERAVALCPGNHIKMEDLPEGLRNNLAQFEEASECDEVVPSLSTLAESKDEAERTRISIALDRNKNNRLRAAAELGISRMTLYKKLHKYGMVATAAAV